MEIKVLGVGCSKCDLLAERVQTAVTDLGLQATVVKVSNMEEILACGVLALPALVVNDKVLVKGFVPSLLEVKSMLSFQKR